MLNLTKQKVRSAISAIALILVEYAKVSDCDSSS